MPPRSRKGKGGAATASSQAQSTLSFNNKSARVTKPGNRQDVAVSKLSELAQAQIEEEVTAPEEEEEGTTEIVEVTTITPEPEVQLPSIQKSETKRQKRDADKDERELAAERITDAQLKKYWQAEEASRLAPRVHQSSLPLHEKILRHFDLSSQYGPCIGIQRLQRWKRANMLGLEPPVEVLAVLLREEDGNNKKSQGCGKLAYIDELAGGRVVLVE